MDDHTDAITTTAMSTDTETSTSRSRVAADGLSKDETFHLLSNQRRRNALWYLRDHDGAVSMRDLAEWIAAQEHETTVAQLTSDERQRVYIALYQSHLPKLADYGVIEYNQSRGIVRRTPLAEQLDPYLEVRADDTDAAGETEPSDGEADFDGPVSLLERSALGIGALGIGIVAAGALDLLPAMSLLAITWTALIIVVSPVGTAELMKRAGITDR